ncbi:MAG: DinB family protein [Hyphomicrobiales bacterium]
MIGPNDLAEYVARVHERTRDVVSAVPPGLLAWRQSPGEFTLAELVVHIARTRLWNAEMIAGNIHAKYGGHDAADYPTLPDLQALVDQTGERTMQLISSAELTFEIPSTMGPIPAWRRVFGGLIEHEVHHRSQLCTLLAQNGIQPPALYGIFEEDLPR